MNKPNHQFKIGDWVIGKEGNVIFKVQDIRVFGDSFGYSGDDIDGWFSEEDIIGFPIKKPDVEEALAHLNIAKRNRGEK